MVAWGLYLPFWALMVAAAVVQVNGAGCIPDGSAIALKAWLL